MANELDSAVISGLKYNHDFQRDRLVACCSLCHGTWPSSDGVVSKYHSCTICGLSVHTGCRLMAKMCHPCDGHFSTTKTLLETDLSRLLQLKGRLFVKLLHAYDLPLPTGTTLFGVSQLSSSPAYLNTVSTTSSTPRILETAVASVGDGDCVWVGGADGDFDTDTDLCIELQPSQDPSSSPPPTLSSVPSVIVEIRKRVMRIFDSPVARCEVSLLPLLLHPGVTAERWFEMKCERTGTRSGMLLLRLLLMHCDENESSRERISAAERSRTLRGTLLSHGPVSDFQDIDFNLSYANDTKATSEHNGFFHSRKSDVVIRKPGAINRSSSSSSSDGSAQDSSQSNNSGDVSTKSSNSSGSGSGSGSDSLGPNLLCDTPTKKPDYTPALRSESNGSTATRPPSTTDQPELPAPCQPVTTPASLPSEAACPSPTTSPSPPWTRTTPPAISLRKRNTPTSHPRKALPTETPNDCSPVLLNTAREGEFSFSQGLVPTRNGEAVMGESDWTREDSRTPDPLPTYLSSPVDRITAPSSSSITATGNIAKIDTARGVNFSMPSMDSSGIDTYYYTGRNVNEGGNEGENEGAATSVSLRRRRGKHDRSTSSLSTSSRGGERGAGERESASRIGKDRDYEGGAQAKGSKRSIKNGDTDRRDSGNSVIGKRKEREKEKGEDKRGSSLLSPVTPIGVAHWLMAAGSSALNYLERQLVDPDERGSQTENGHLAIRGAEGAGGGAGTGGRGGSGMDLEGPGVEMRRGSEGEIGRNGPMGSGPEGMEGVGRIHVNLVSAFKSLVSDAAEGDHYVVCGIDGEAEDKQQRTQTVRSSATPVFNRNWVFTAPHYRSVLRLTLMDANSDKKVATSSMSLYAMQLRDIEHHRGEWRAALSRVDRMVLRDPVADGKALTQVANTKSLARRAAKEQANGEVGHLLVSIAFEEDFKGLFSGAIRKAPSPPEEAMSMERLSAHISRFQSIISPLTRAYESYCRIMDWEDPFLTLSLLVLFVYTTFNINAEYALCCPIFVLLALFTKSLVDRKSGKFRMRWVEDGNGSTVPVEKYQPIAIMRLAVVGYKNLPSFLPDTRKPLPVAGGASVAQSSSVGHGLSDVNIDVIPPSSPHTPPPSPSHPVPRSPSIDIPQSQYQSQSQSHLFDREGQRRRGAPPFVKVTYLPMSSEDVRRLSAAEMDSEDSALRDTRGGASREIEREGEGAGPERSSSKDRQGQSQAQVPVREVKAPITKSIGTAGAKRELLVGCLCPTQRSSAGGQALDGSFSQLVASLSMGLSRTESTSNDSLLHNTFDPWPWHPHPHSSSDPHSHSHSSSSLSSVSGSSQYMSGKDRNTYGGKEGYRGIEGTEGDFVPTSEGLGSADIELDMALVYPLLQPLSDSLISSKTTPSDGSAPSQSSLNRIPKGTKGPKGSFSVPWSRNTGHVKLSLFADDPSSFLGAPWGSARANLTDFLSSDAEGPKDPDVGSTGEGDDALGGEERLIWCDIQYTQQTSVVSVEEVQDNVVFQPQRKDAKKRNGTTSNLAEIYEHEDEDGDGDEDEEDGIERDEEASVGDLVGDRDGSEEKGSRTSSSGDERGDVSGDGGDESGSNSSSSSSGISGSDRGSGSGSGSGCGSDTDSGSGSEYSVISVESACSAGALARTTGRRRAQYSKDCEEDDDVGGKRGRKRSDRSSPLTGLNKHLDSRRRLYDRTRRRRDSSDAGDAPSSSLLSLGGGEGGGKVKGAPLPSGAGQPLSLSGIASSEQSMGMVGVTTSTSGGRSAGTTVHVGVGVGGSGAGRGPEGSQASQRRYGASSVMSNTSAGTAQSYGSHKDKGADRDSNGDSNRGRGQSVSKVNMDIKSKSKIPQVLLRVRLDMGAGDRKVPTKQAVDTSRALQQLLTLKDDKEGGSTISVIWNMRDNVKYVQNRMAWILDLLESIKNIFTWVVPAKTFPIYWSVVAVWLVTVFVPGRWLILAIGLYEFFYLILPESESDAMSIRAANLLTALPNDDDLEQTFRRERSAHLTARAVHDADISRAASLRLILPCKWKGSVLLHGDTAQDGSRTNYPRASSSSSSRSMLGDLGNLLGAGWGDSWGAKVQDPHSAAGLVGGNAMGWAWREVHLVLQGHRLVWWESEHDIDDGKACVGQLLLYGHAGTTQASPVLVRELGGHGLFDSRLVCVFGRDTAGSPKRCTLLCADSSSRESLAKLIAEALT